MTGLEARSTIGSEGLCRRYVSELRFEGDRIITGVAMRYGDVADLPWGGRERFESGAFGDLGRADVILNVQHCRERMLCRTGGGGLTVDDNPQELRIRAEIPNTQEGNDVLELVQKRVLRGLSIEFVPDKHISDMRDDGTEVRIIQEAKLQNIAIVDRPAYPNARLNPRSQSMDETEIRALIEKALEARSSDTSINVEVLTRGLKDMMSKSIEGAVSSRVNGMVKEAMKEREAEMADEMKRQIDDMMGEKERALAEKDDAEKRAAEEKAASEEKAKEERERLEADAEERAELLMMAKPLLAEDFEVRGKSNQEILVAAVGDEVKDADKRSEDYLRAKVEGIVERRAAADDTRQRNAGGAPNPGGDMPKSLGPTPGAGTNMFRLAERMNPPRMTGTARK